MISRTFQEVSSSLKTCNKPIIFCKRQASFASAINRGLRRASDRSSRLGSVPRKREDDNHGRPGDSLSRLQLARTRDTKNESRYIQRRPQRSSNNRTDISYEAPFGKPYTTAGSEFLYGTFAVKAALEASRRKFYKLYIWKGERSADDEYDISIHQLARARRLPIQYVAGSWDKMLLKMSNQRPHNGIILEASPIPKVPIVTLKSLSTPESDLVAIIGSQSQEDKEINDVFTTSGSQVNIPRGGHQNRFPLLLWLDMITDTGNLGAIMRTAYFMGVDAIVVPEHGTAPFSPVTIKASAGAAEVVPIMVVKQEIEFVRKSQENGWKFIAAVAPDSASTWKKLSQQGSFVAESALENHPCVLMVGNEGEGLRPAMQKAADNFVSIRGIRGPSNGVESLNVSVAAALLIARMFSKTPAPKTVHPTESTQKPPTEDESSLF